MPIKEEKIKSELYKLVAVLVALITVAIIILAYVYFTILSPHNSTVTTGSHIISPTPEPSYNSSIYNNTIPSVMTPGKKYDITISSINIGDATWLNNTTFIAQLINNPYDPVLFSNVSTLEKSAKIKRGINYTWKFRMTAPKLSGNYTIAYQMKNNTTYFGTILVKNITVGTPNDDVLYLSQNIQYYPSLMPNATINMKLGSFQNVSITVKNMGRDDWSDVDDVRLAAVDYEPNNASLFNPALLFHIAPDSVITPNQQCTWKFKLQAPETPGIYYIKYQMEQDDQWFGNKLNVTVIVK